MKEKKFQFKSIINPMDNNSMYYNLLYSLIYDGFISIEPKNEMSIKCDISMVVKELPINIPSIATEEELRKVFGIVD